MRYIASTIIATVLSACAAVQATELVYQSSNVKVRLHETDCSVPELALAIASNGGGRPAQAATVTFGGKDLRACWAILPDNNVLIVDEDLDGGVIPAVAFKPAPVV